MDNVEEVDFPTIRTPEHIVALMRIEEEMKQLRIVVLKQDQIIQELEAKLRAFTYGAPNE